MNKNKMLVIFKFLLVLTICFSLLVGWVQMVSADTCTWEGDTDSYWHHSANWSCGHVPTSSDDVVIPSGMTNNPIGYASEGGVFANTIQINEGAELTIASYVQVNTLTNDGTLNADASTYHVSINSSVSGFTINNNGTFHITGTLNVEVGLYGDGVFNNIGIVDIQNTNDRRLYLYNTAGTHSGTFQGNNLSLVGNKTNIFSAFSSIDLNIWGVYDGVVNFEGTISSLGELNDAGTLNILETANVSQIAQKVYTDYPSELVLGNPSGNYSIPELYLYYGELQNEGTLSISDKLVWQLGSFKGDGSTIVTPGALFTMTSGDKILDHQTLINQTTTNWNNGNITLLNSAIFENDGTFNANATTAMDGGETESFINDGTFIKDTDSTTTTMNLPFTNNGTVQVLAGELIFQQGMDNGDGAIINVGEGSLDPGETLNLGSGSSLIGAGTLNANLVNAGTVSPGTSPGLITVDGDYTQDVSGALEIELGNPDYDKLAATGAANLDGTLNVTLLPGFTPQSGDSFIIMSYGSQTGSFATLDLPEGYEWELNYDDTDLVISVATGGSINGTITCSGSIEGATNTVFVDLWKDSYEGPPDDTRHISCGDSYTFDNLEDGTYYVDAWLDLNDSGNGPPDDGEPAAWYDLDEDGQPDEIVVSGGSEVTGIDIILEKYDLYLPLILR